LVVHRGLKQSPIWSAAISSKKIFKSAHFWETNPRPIARAGSKVDGATHAPEVSGGGPSLHLWLDGDRQFARPKPHI